MSCSSRRQTAAWAFLIVATLVSFWTHAHIVTQRQAVAGIMTIAAVKIFVVLRRFMRADHLPVSMQLYFVFWSAGCAAMIAIMVALSV